MATGSLQPPQSRDTSSLRTTSLASGYSPSSSRTRQGSVGRRTGEPDVEILGGNEDFFGSDWEGTVATGAAGVPGDDDEDLTEQEDEEQEDFAGHSVHTEGVPSSEIKLKAKEYKSSSFAATLLTLLREEFAIEGWDDLPHFVQPSALSIHKVSGSLTNAVFFVSCPSPPAEESAHVWEPAPTVLVRIYGPASGSLISRQHELHLLHTLSATYGIGPMILGTFHNGRIEEYFDSRALHKEELRDARISRWIARRMRELHSVDLNRMFAEEVTSGSRQGSRERSASAERRPSLKSIRWSNGSTSSLLSTSSQGSNFSWSSAYSSGSEASSGFNLGNTVTSSPGSMTPTQPGAGTSESRAIRKKRSRSRMRTGSVSLSSISRERDKGKVGSWDNIKRWNREAAKVLVEINALATAVPSPEGPATPTSPEQAKHNADLQQLEAEAFSPLSSPSSLIRFAQTFDMPRFHREIKAYRAWVKGKEKEMGKSKRVFSHNDTQYGNLLIRRTDQDVLNERPHEQIMVIDFEYASPNPRAFDIANHFHEWRADYHHDELSYSLTNHGDYPTLSERRRFYRAYVGADMGYDGLAAHDPRTPLLSPFAGATLTEEEISHLSLDDQRELEDERGQNKTASSGLRQQSHPAPNAAEKASAREDPRVLRLEEEVKVWSACSHAQWAVWGIVQALDDIQTRVKMWRARGQFGLGPAKAKIAPEAKKEEGADGDAQKADGVQDGPKLHRTRSGELRDEHDDLVMDDTPATHEIEFDFLGYSLSRIALFRQEIGDLGIQVEY